MRTKYFHMLFPLFSPEIITPSRTGNDIHNFFLPLFHLLAYSLISPFLWFVPPQTFLNVCSALVLNYCPRGGPKGGLLPLIPPFVCVIRTTQETVMSLIRKRHLLTVTGATVGIILISDEMSCLQCACIYSLTD